jgi:hypothetical protein
MFAVTTADVLPAESMNFALTVFNPASLINVQLWLVV